MILFSLREGGRKQTCLFGKPVAEKIYENLKKDLERLKVKPAIGVILAGEDPASLAYIKIKEKIAFRLGIEFKLFHLPGFTTEKNVLELVEELNINKHITGIVVQLPLPENFDTEEILKKINPKKDIDGFYGNFPAPTAQAILEILKFYNISLSEKKIVIVGHGRLVGQPLERLLLKNGLKPVVCDSETKDLKSVLRAADIIITATGVPELIKPEMVKKEAVIIDAGSAEAKGKMVGDISPLVYEIVNAYSPVPGGVGPVTVACLMKNVVEAAKKQKIIP